MSASTAPALAIAATMPPTCSRLATICRTTRIRMTRIWMTRRMTIRPLTTHPVETIRSKVCPYQGSRGAPHPRFPVEVSDCREVHAVFLTENRTRCPVQRRVQEIRGISLVFREMWVTTALNPQVLVLNGHSTIETCRIPHLAKNERDMGHPGRCCTLELAYLVATWAVEVFSRRRIASW